MLNNIKLAIETLLFPAAVRRRKLIEIHRDYDQAMMNADRVRARDYRYARRVGTIRDRSVLAEIENGCAASYKIADDTYARRLAELV